VVPLPPRVALAWTVVRELAAIEPLTSSVPAATAVAPV